MKTQIILSASTAFVIGFAGAIGVVAGSGNAINSRAWALSVIVGAAVAAKDVRSLMKLPPVQPPGNTEILTKQDPKP